MDKKELVKEGNVLIAKFMEVREVHPDRWEYAMGASILPSSDMRYNKSWDWLMPVVDKINLTQIKTKEYSSIVNEKTDLVTQFDVVISHRQCKITKSTIRGSVDDFLGTWDGGNFRHEITTREATYRAVVTFIKWYNKTINNG